MNAATEGERAALKAEAVRRVRQALRQIEDAQGSLNAACATLSSLRYANQEWRITSKLADRVKAHWYKVRDALEYGPRSRKVQLDDLATECALEKLRKVAP